MQETEDEEDYCKGLSSGNGMRISKVTSLQLWLPAQEQDQPVFQQATPNELSELKLKKKIRVGHEYKRGYIRYILKECST